MQVVAEGGKGWWGVRKMKKKKILFATSVIKGVFNSLESCLGGI